jgi:hypothetical protein
LEGSIEYNPEENWFDDTKGKAVMEFADFSDAMFELAKMW